LLSKNFGVKLKICYFQVGKTTDSADSKSPDSPPGLFFRHAGHRYDMEWLRAFLSVLSS